MLRRVVTAEAAEAKRERRGKRVRQAAPMAEPEWGPRQVQPDREEWEEPMAELAESQEPAE